MILSKVLEGVAVTKMFQTTFGQMVVTHEVEVPGIQYDSRKVHQGDLFVAIRGSAADGHQFIPVAVQQGAKVVVVEDDAAIPDSFFMHAGVTKVVVGDSREALARISTNFYGHPSRRLRLVGITGTNGKTTTTHLIKSILEAHGERVGLIGTIEHMIGSEKIPATHTTPESLELNQLLRSMVDRGCSAAVMEVSSHALALKRVAGLEFAVAGFTNLTQDHLDFHGSMEEYFKAKSLLFEMLSPGAWAATNLNDLYGERIVGNTEAKVLRYGTSPLAEVAATDISLAMSGSRCRVVYQGATHELESSLIGRFNVHNILGAYATGIALGIPHATIARGISSLKGVRGRFEQIQSPKDWTAVIDYAHTPDALENCLRAIHEILPADSSSRIITIFGCGGNRDRGKRPTMARIATELSDVTIITSDNPRKEDPQAIIDEVVQGVAQGKRYLTEVDRRKAIVLGLKMAAPGDVVLIAGKGHETYQVIGETRTHFDDREEVEAFIRNAP